MYIEYACYDPTITDEDFKKTLSTLIEKYNIKNIATFHTNIITIKSLKKNIDISCPIDYPYGILDSKTRIFAISQAIKAGASTIDLVAPAKYISNRKYDKLRDDIKTSLELCEQENIKLRYILEYRTFNHETLSKVCQILKSFNINEVLPSTGQFIDDIYDNIIAAKYLTMKSNISVICNGNIWIQKHIDTLKNANIYGVRVQNLASLELFNKNSVI
jgi:deoxyribose-phosphate aldolase